MQPAWRWAAVPPMGRAGKQAAGPRTMRRTCFDEAFPGGAVSSRILSRCLRGRFAQRCRTRCSFPACRQWRCRGRGNASAQRAVPGASRRATCWRCATLQIEVPEHFAATIGNAALATGNAGGGHRGFRASRLAGRLRRRTRTMPDLAVPRPGAVASAPAHPLAVACRTARRQASSPPYAPVCRLLSKGRPIPGGIAHLRAPPSRWPAGLRRDRCRVRHQGTGMMPFVATASIDRRPQ